MERERFLLKEAMSIASSASMIIASAFLIWATMSASRGSTRTVTVSREVVPPSAPQPIDGAATKGDRSAPVAMIMYSDFQCPYCGHFARETLPRLEQQYIRSGKLLLVFRHAPLEQIHPLALKAGEAAECAAQQGKFWEMHDVLFAPDASLDLTHLFAAARVAQVDTVAFGSCVSQDRSAKIRADAAIAQALTLTSTPSFLIGDNREDGVRVAKVITGAQPFNTFSAAIDLLLVGEK